MEKPEIDFARLSSMLDLVQKIAVVAPRCMNLSSFTMLEVMAADEEVKAWADEQARVKAQQDAEAAAEAAEQARAQQAEEEAASNDTRERTERDRQARLQGEFARANEPATKVVNEPEVTTAPVTRRA